MSAINFVINLSTEFRSEIDLKSLETGLLFFGMSVMKELLVFVISLQCKHADRFVNTKQNLHTTLLCMCSGKSCSCTAPT
jgi:hypothetical protein